MGSNIVNLNEIAPGFISKVISLYPKDHNKIRIKDIGKVEELISKIAQDKEDHLHVVSDFDFTLSKWCPLKVTCQGLLVRYPGLDEGFRKTANNLYLKYYPVEKDMSRDKGERSRLLTEWYLAFRESLINAEMKRSTFLDAISVSNLILREGSDKLMSTLNQHEIPFLIFSGGMGDVIEEILKNSSLFHPNVSILSNHLIWENGVATGYKPNLIHPGNKYESGVEFFRERKSKGETHRRNSIILGDTLSDLDMARALEIQEFMEDNEGGVVLRIGFLNENDDEELLESYTKEFDIVLIEDQSMDFVNSLLGLVLSKD